MRRLLAAVLVLVVVAVAGFGAYRLGLLARFVGTAPGAGTTLAETSAAPPAPAQRAAGAAGAAAADLPATPVPGGSAANAGVPPVAQEASLAPTREGQAASQAAPPIPPGLVAVGQSAQPIANKSIEVRVTDVATAPAIGNRKAADGREFVVVSTSWKSLIPPQKVNRKKAQDRTAGMGSLGFGGGATSKDQADDEANTTIEEVPFAMGPMSQHVWLIVNGGAAEPIAVDATRGVQTPLSTATLTIPGFEKVVSGALAFEASAGASSLALLVLDSINGHLLVPIKGEAPTLVAGLGGAARSNDLVDLALAGTSWADSPSSAPGTRMLIVGVKGISRQPAIAQIPFGSFAFLQTSQGCIAQPEARAPQVTRTLAPMGVFLPFVPSEGQLAFAVPSDTSAATLLVRLRQGGSIDLPVLGDGSAVKPTAAASHDDGTVLRVHVIGTGAPPSGLPNPKPGFEYLAVDYMVENLKAGTGLELQPAAQFALADDAGAKYVPDRASQQLPCRLTGANVVPAGGWRRFSLAYVVPAGQPLTLKYRGFESEGTLNVR